jgi:hypothetical protein
MSQKLSEEEIIRAEVARLMRAEKVVTAWTPDDLDSRPTKAQLEPVLSTMARSRYCYIFGGNQSGKSIGQIRTLVWMAEESSPYWRRPSDNYCNNKLCGHEGNLRSLTAAVRDYECPKCGNVWTVWDKDMPLNILLVGEQLKNIQENLYFPRIKRLFQNPEEWHEDKMGSPYIQKVTNKRTGNNILFFPHGHGEEKARKVLQGYSIHAVFMDEQAPKKVIEELQRRVDAWLGTFMAAFTMKHVDPDLLRFIDAQVLSGAAKVFKLSKLDNPVYAGRKDMVMAQLAGLSEAEKNVILYGEVSFSDEYIFGQVGTEEIGQVLPSTYATSWRHVEIIDPAVKSKAGRLVVAQDPHTKIWHVIQAQTLKGMLHDTHLYEGCLKLREKEGYKPIKCVADDDAGFIGAAMHHPTPTRYIYPPSKRRKDRGKLYLIKQTVGCLVSGILKIDPKFTILWDEIRSYRWKEGSKTEIQNSHKYHTLDTLMYFFDTLPEEERGEIKQKTYHEEIVEANLVTRAERVKEPLQNKRKAIIMGPSLSRIMR